jgi:tetratricopeptide (TPR) repeat protein
VLSGKKRISKKEMKQDKLVTSYYSAYNYFLENQAKILIGLGVLALIVVAVILISNKKSSDNLNAANLLAKVVPLYESGLYQEAIDGQPSSNITGLKNIVDEYGSTESGQTAKIYLANSYSFLDKWEEAYKLYDSYGGSNPFFEATALAGQASYYELKNDNKKASELYKKAAKISKTNPANPEYLFKTALNLMKLGKNDEAKSLFKEIKNEYKLSVVVQEIDRYLHQLEG